jgi:hypothetical protein
LGLKNRVEVVVGVQFVSLSAAVTSTGMTLADLIQFVQAAEAAGVDPRRPVKVRCGFRGQILRLDATTEPFKPDPPRPLGIP